MASHTIWFRIFLNMLLISTALLSRDSGLSICNNFLKDIVNTLLLFSLYVYFWWLNSFFFFSFFLCFFRFFFSPTQHFLLFTAIIPLHFPCTDRLPQLAHHSTSWYPESEG